MTETVLRRSIERGLTAADFETMTLGMVVDYLIVCNNEDLEEKNRKKTKPKRYATAEDIAAF